MLIIFKVVHRRLRTISHQTTFNDVHFALQTAYVHNQSSNRTIASYLLKPDKVELDSNIKKSIQFHAFCKNAF